MVKHNYNGAFKRFVQTGRVVRISDGPHRGKLSSIVDVINQTTVLVDGPETGVPRSALRLNQLHLTKLKINFPFNARTKVVRKAWKDGQVEEKWSKSLWAQKVANVEKRKTLTDFDRFKLSKLRRTRNKIRSAVFYRLKKEYLNRKFGEKKKKPFMSAKKIAAAKAKKPTKKDTDVAKKQEKKAAKRAVIAKKRATAKAEKIEKIKKGRAKRKAQKKAAEAPPAKK
ncbi:hypothetical protein M8J76_008559 [Diaphorina citri]|nr:hypothetical protein M8J75_008900 [Diaphorina citri]KAI5719320.1 hypothetical protein M8J76_008559 [Diaphorina citri]KAI5721100.1 hypothetical protein M8J77_015929 [Diaphorina citri]